MISYLKGLAVDFVNNTGNRVIVILEVNNIGYELQIPSRLARKLSGDKEKIVQVFTHQQVKEDQQLLYGFATAPERDLFRQLIGVTGIGAQSAIALIDTLGFDDLIEAIVSSNLNALAKAPGVGKKTAERLSLELKSKLDGWRLLPGSTASSAQAIPTEVIQEVELTLGALGYTKQEIEQALSVLSKDYQLLKNPNVEEWIRKAIAHLSL